MSTLQVRKILSNLQRKGFIIDKKRDHVYLNYLTAEGKKTPIRTKVSHGENEIGDSLIARMAMQTRLSKEQFIDLVNCPLSKEDYFQIVKEIL